MKNTDILINFVSDSELPQLQKNVMIGFINRSNQEQETEREVRELIKNVTKIINLSEVIISTDEVKIYTVYNIHKNDDWDNKYPYRSIFLNSEGVWERISTVAPNLDMAYLVYLEYKHLGSNSQFSSFASKMLGIDKY